MCLSVGCTCLLWLHPVNCVRDCQICGTICPSISRIPTDLDNVSRWYVNDPEEEMLLLCCDGFFSKSAFASPQVLTLSSLMYLNVVELYLLTRV